MKQFFAPSKFVINQLPYAAKFALIGVLFCFPIVVAICNLVGKINVDVDFARKEQHGIEYNQVIKNVYVRANEYWGSVHQGQAADKAPVEEAIKALAAIDGQYATELSTAEKLKGVNEKLQSFMDAPSSERLNAVNTDLVGFISHIGDKSNLILDPRLDSYYVMDSVVLRLLPVTKNLGELLAVAEESASAGHVSHSTLVKLIDLKDQMKLNYEALKYGMDVAYKFEQTAALTKSALDGYYTQTVAQMDALLATYDKQLIDNENAKPSLALINELKTQHSALGNSLSQLYDAQSKILNQLIQQRSDEATPIIQATIGWTIVALLIIGYLFIGFYVAVNDSFDELITATQKMAQGDLRQVLSSNSKDEYSKVATGFNAMVESFKKLIHSIQSGVNDLKDSSVELEATSTQMKDSAGSMSAQTEHTSHLTDELANNIMVVASAVEQSSTGVKEVALASDSVIKSIEVAQNATDEMSENMTGIALATSEMSGSVNTIASAVEEMSASLKEVSNNTHHASDIAIQAEDRAHSTQNIVSQLESSAREIGQVIEVINGIAAQTNLLALNATIQAASAGEAGKGFAVVANEVKELAKKSANATVDIRQRVEEIQHNTSSAIGAIDDITKIIGQIADINRTIANSVQEQTTATNEISSSIASTALAASNVSDNIQRSASVADQLNDQIKQAETGVKMISKNVEEIAMGTTEISRSSSSVATLAQDMASSVHVVRENTSDVAGSAAKTKHSADNLGELANELNRLVATFKV
jgi:methyl-accepting chemotaxis protein